VSLPVDTAALQDDLLSRGVRLASLDVLAETDSTNQRLLAAPAPPPGQLAVCIADYQSAGRGRRGRQWRAPPGTALCLSVAWQFREARPDLLALPLAVGVAVRRAIASLIGQSIALKWPNDLVFADRKLGGILVELASGDRGRCHVVAGIGINIAMPAMLLPRLCDWAEGAIDLATLTGQRVPERAALAAALIAETAAAFHVYASSGFAPSLDAWLDADCLAGRAVRVEQQPRTVEGIARGIDRDGALLVDVGGAAPARVLAGDVTVRIRSESRRAGP
jgi:BirA family transcriptional regulator, biotin operon repressor / biotin---[acetyl-CoA-carboxylase] ligase